MRRLMTSKWLLLCLLIAVLVVTDARRGGGSRGSSSRGSSRGSSGRVTQTNRGRGSSSSGANYPRQPAPLPAPPPVKPKAPPPAVARQPPYNPNYPGGQQKPPPYSPRENPPPYSPPGGQGAPPPYSPQGRPPNSQQSGNVPPPPYSPPQSSGVAGANYPRQPGVNPGGYPPNGGVPGANYPRQPGSNPNYPGEVHGANYPRQPGANPNYPSSGGFPGANYPRQPSISTGNQPHGQPGMPHGGGIPGANYPRQQYYPANSLGSNVWQPQSGRPAPSYMNYGGLPTGANMQNTPLKKKGFLGSLTSMGSHKPMGNKYYGSKPSPFAMGGYGAMGGMGGGHFGSSMGGGGFLGKYGSKAVMYTILPYMAMRTASSLFRPRFYSPMFLPSPFYHHNYYHYHNHGWGHDSRRIDVLNNDYVGKCNRPLTPSNGNLSCTSDYKQVQCDVRCQEGYRYEDNTTAKENKCWHVTGVWRPTKNYPACQPVCNKTCLNGGVCIAPDVCGCQPEYRGPHCEFYFLNCDVRKLAAGNRISWVCTHSKNESSCRVKCRTPDTFASPPAESYTCTPDGVWTPAALPRCVSPDSIQNVSTDKASEVTEISTISTTAET